MATKYQGNDCSKYIISNINISLSYITLVNTCTHIGHKEPN